MTTEHGSQTGIKERENIADQSRGVLESSRDWSGLRRIMIVGQPGAGKSTLAARLGERTGLPVIHIDKIHWQAGWLERSKAEKTRLCLEAEQQDQWVFEGGHSATWPSRLARANMLVWLDLPVGQRLWRVVRRAIVGLGRTRPDMAEGCPERLRSLPEFIAYIWTTRRSAQQKLQRLAESAPDGCEVVRLQSDADSAAFLERFTG
jgi:adenylate kinase family enzyme